MKRVYKIYEDENFEHPNKITFEYPVKSFYEDVVNFTVKKYGEAFVKVVDHGERSITLYHRYNTGKGMSIIEDTKPVKMKIIDILTDFAGSGELVVCISSLGGRVEFTVQKFGCKFKIFKDAETSEDGVVTGYYLDIFDTVDAVERYIKPKFQRGFKFWYPCDVLKEHRKSQERNQKIAELVSFVGNDPQKFETVAKEHGKYMTMAVWWSYIRNGGWSKFFDYEPDMLTAHNKLLELFGKYF